MRFIKFIILIAFIFFLLIGQQEAIVCPGFTISDFEIGAQTDYMNVPIETLASGCGIERQYAQQKQISHFLSYKKIFWYAARASLRPDSALSIEKICYNIIKKSIDALAKVIAPYLWAHPQDITTVVLCGGVMHHVGRDYQKYLSVAFNKQFNGKQKISLVTSSFDNESAVVGTVIIAQEGRYYPPQSYALGIDLGGTYMRAGLVDIKTSKPVGKIISKFTFASKGDHDAMKRIQPKIQGAANKYSNLAYIPSNVRICHFLPNKNDRKIHAYLKSILMNRLCVLIKNFDLTRIQYISIASPGLNGSGGYVKLAFNVPLTTVNIVKELHKKLQKKIPIYLTGDVASAGVGELVMGIGKRIKQFFILKIGTGINLCYVDGGNFR